MPSKVPAHGTRARYNRGCSCSKCRAANAEYFRRYYAGEVEPRPRAKHGQAAKYNAGCRCPRCKKAKSKVMKEYYARTAR